MSDAILVLNAGSLIPFHWRRERALTSNISEAGRIHLEYAIEG